METRLNTKQVAELKGCSEQFIRKLAKEGKLKGKKPPVVAPAVDNIEQIQLLVYLGGR